MKRVIFIVFVILIVCLTGCKPKLGPKGLGLVETPEMLFKSFRAAGPKAGSGSAPELAADVDLSAYFPKPGDQGMIGSCTAWATAYACKSFHENIEREWGADKNDHIFSPSYIYNQINGGVDQGSAIEYAVALVIEKGCASLATMPYTENFLLQPSQNAHLEAQNYRALSFARVDFTDTESVKRVLSEGNAVLFGLEMFENLWFYTGGVYDTIDGPSLGGHAMCAVGYDEGKQAFKVINSWGDYWGEGGYVWLHYDIFTRYTMTAIVMYDQVVYHPEEAAVPVNIEASRGSFFDKIEVTWEKAKNARSYRVYRSAEPDANFVKAASTLGTTWFDTDVAGGEIYYYAVRSIGVAGESDFSESAEGFAGVREEEIGVPQNLDGMFEEDTVYMRWDSIQIADGYHVYRFYHDKENYLRVGTTRDTSFRHREAFEDGEVLWYIVTAYRGEKESDPSGAFSVTVEIPEEAAVIVLSPPKKVTASEAEFEDRIRVSWEAVPDAETYEIGKWNDGAKAWERLAETGETFFEEMNPPSPAGYYTVAARSGDVVSAPSDPAIGYLKEHEVVVIDGDAAYDDTEYYDDTEFEDTDYKDEDKYRDDEEVKGKEIIFDDFPDDTKKKDKDKDKPQKTPEPVKKKEIITGDEALDKVRQNIEKKAKEDDKDKGKSEEEKALEKRTKDLVKDGFKDEEFFGTEEEDKAFFDENEEAEDDDFFDDDFFDEEDDF
ncbi:MAG: hypothetical protein JW881_00550 [Spirochaetales bacterium]|nr:hypothetical protein [Spirochaetales bacterium]